MKPENIVVIGVKHAVLAFARDTGEHLWATELKSGAEQFVSLASDTQRVFAHSGGELHCLDLMTGAILWRDKLKGFGFGLASLALPGSASPTVNPVQQQMANQAASASIASGIATSH